MPRQDARKRFIGLLQSVAAKHGLEMETFSKDWIIQISDPASGRRCSIFGYTFDVNGAGAAEICKEKSATSLVLQKRGVACIPHHVFLNPANEFTAAYVPPGGNWEEVLRLAREVGFPVVVKPLKGTGGVDVFKAKCPRDLEAAVQRIFAKDYGLALSPYKEIVDEYRCFCVGGTVEFIYRKVRSQVVGDGASSVTALVQRAIGAAASAREAQAVASAAAQLDPEQWAHVPREGEAVPLQWKHNLGQGAQADCAVEPDKARALEAVALAAAQAVGIYFCSADIIEVKGEGYMVMELNGGVMMDSLIDQLGDAGVAQASRIYEVAVLRALGGPPS